MKVTLVELTLTTRKTVERIQFSPTVTFLYGPVGTGKSTVARLIDYCFGGDLEQTPAIQREFVAVRLAVDLGPHRCEIERGARDTTSVRVSWSSLDLPAESVVAPLGAEGAPILGERVYNLSDLLFHLCGVEPIKVRKRYRDAESDLVRLSFRDVWWYCYLEQTHLDSSFFRLEDAFKGRKSQDAMRFITGLHSERFSQLESELFRVLEQQKIKRESVTQIRQFMSRFEFGTEDEIEARIEQAKADLEDADARRRALDQQRSVAIHPTDPLRTRLRQMSAELDALRQAEEEATASIGEQRALRAELITTKVKAQRTEQAGQLLTGVEYDRCPQCAADISARPVSHAHCRLCGSDAAHQGALSSLELESVRRELNERIDQLDDAIRRREGALARSRRQIEQVQTAKSQLDVALQQQLAQYDSAFVQSVRSIERESATLAERIRQLERLRQLPSAIQELLVEAAALTATIDQLRESMEVESSKLQYADANIAAIAAAFRRVMLDVGFPGVTPNDVVRLEPRNWRPVVVHDGEQIWGFADAGSGGKKTLFNVCYALAIHEVALERGLPLPTVLIIDSPTKNISDEENPELLKALYRAIYRLAARPEGQRIQLLLIDSDLAAPESSLPGFLARHIAGDAESPSLIPYYVGP